MDLRETPLVTIDGADARDFDDAVYCERRARAGACWWPLPTCAHYVRKDSPLDKEGLERGTSVYFTDRVIPMLPEQLSNGLCSLNPEVDRLAMVCEMQVDPDGKVTRSKFYEAVIRSAARLTYTEVSDMMVKGDKALRKKHAACYRTWTSCLTSIVRSARRAGSAARSNSRCPSLTWCWARIAGLSVSKPTNAMMRTG